MFAFTAITTKAKIMEIFFNTNRNVIRCDCFNVIQYNQKRAHTFAQNYEQKSHTCKSYDQNKITSLSLRQRRSGSGFCWRFFLSLALAISSFSLNIQLLFCAALQKIIRISFVFAFLNNKNPLIFLMYMQPYRALRSRRTRHVVQKSFGEVVNCKIATTNKLH